MIITHDCDMPKALYFVDSIYSSVEGDLSVVNLLTTDASDNEGHVSVTVPRGQLRMGNHPGTIKEGWYVFYDAESQDSFSYGNNTAYARRQFREFKSIIEQLSQNNTTEESGENRSLLERYSCDHGIDIVSYHVNVGHGNCSLILIHSNEEFQIWMVDCSLSERRNGNRFSPNLEACFKEIRKRLGKRDEEPLIISRFFLTHPHCDHYAGVEYLVKHGYINDKTLCYWNIYYHMAGAKYIQVLKTLQRANVKFIEPISGNSTQAIRFLHPECRIFRSRGTVGSYKPKHRVVNHLNNCSTVIRFLLGGKKMVFPGDLEVDGFDEMTKRSTCSPELFRIDYYAISHHGSANGHPVNPCMSPVRHHPPTPLHCISCVISKAILMGRNGAYNGIYDPGVINYWTNCNNSLVYVERATHYVELEWGNGNIKMV